jgi:tRNA pseudouridine13 synthase
VVDAPWPRSTAENPIPARIKVTCEDFVVRERLGIAPSGEGEHLLVEIEKSGMTTPELARMLADAHGLDHVDVSYAGMKDKRAVTSQWFSLRGVDVLDEAVATIDGVRLLDQTRHSRKLRRGELAGNEFCIRLRSVDAERACERITSMAETGAPNYFGAQRFGRDNLEKATAWLSSRRRRRVTRFKQSLYLSVLRSFLFNEVLARRVAAGNWNRVMEGDCLDANGDPTGPLWGRGRTATDALAATLETSALAPHVALLEGLEHAGVTQARRAFVLRPRDLTVHPLQEGVEVRFVLGPGGYATSLLADRFDLIEGPEEVLPAGGAARAAGGGER